MGSRRPEADATERTVRELKSDKPRLAAVSGDGEFHSNLGLRSDRLSRLVIRLKAPLLDGFTRGSKKNLATTDCLKVLDVPIFVDSGQQHHRPFHRLLFHQKRI